MSDLNTESVRLIAVQNKILKDCITDLLNSLQAQKEINDNTQTVLMNMKNCLEQLHNRISTLETKLILLGANKNDMYQS